MEDKSRMMNKTMSFGILGILMLSIVSAFGVGIYNEPVTLAPGDSIELAFRLQNMVGTTDYLVEPRFSWDEGLEVELLDNKTIYEVPAGELVRVNFKVTALESTRIGELKEIRANMIPQAKSPEGGPLGIETEIGARVQIAISEVTGENYTPQIITVTEEENNTLRNIILILIVLIMATTAAIYIKKKNSKKN
jgi:hypothetical protein